MVGRCDFVAFWVDLRLQYPIIIIFTDVRTTEQSRTVEYTRLDFGEKSGMVWKKIRYEIQFGEKSDMFGKKSGVSREKSGIDTDNVISHGLHDIRTRLLVISPFNFGQTTKSHL
jgi:hypothetical protein